MTIIHLFKLRHNFQHNQASFTTYLLYDILMCLMCLAAAVIIFSNCFSSRNTTADTAKFMFASAGFRQLSAPWYEILVFTHGFCE